MSHRYHVVIVGARCAGATLACKLARGGAKVLLVEQGRLGTDCTLSTHALHPSGMSVVDELGLGAAVRQLSPEMGVMRIDWQGAVLDIRYPDGHGAYCPRRQRFDDLLQQAAVQAGAEVWDCTRAVAVEREAGRVRGVWLVRENGRPFLVETDLVVGADGRNSSIARFVGAKTYYDYDPPRGMYWGYWPAPDKWGRSDEFPAGMYLQREEDIVRVAFHTDDGKLLLGVCPLRQDLERFRQNPLRALRDALASQPMLAPIASVAPQERVRGTRGERYFFRQGAGAGWLLLGDAGVHKDFIGGDGMSEALLQARCAAAAILDANARGGLDHSLLKWWRQRDVAALPLYCHARDLSQPEMGPWFDRVVFPRIMRDPRLLDAFAGVFRREHSPYTLLPMGRMLGWVAHAALTGQPRVILEFLARGKRARDVSNDLHRCQQLLIQATLRPALDERLELPSVPRTASWNALPV